MHGASSLRSRRETCEIAAPLVKNRVRGCAVVLEIDQGRVGTADGSNDDWRGGVALCRVIAAR